MYGTYYIKGTLGTGTRIKEIKPVRTVNALEHRS